MADITTKNKIGIKSGGLHARIAEKELLEEIAPQQADVNTLPNRIAIMIDLSGSMSGEPVKLLEQAIQDFIQKANMADTAIAVESFPEQVRIELTNDKMKLWMLCMGLKADGGTPMSHAMEYSLKNHNSTRAILISDGQPNNEPGTELISCYKTKGIAVDTVHVGNSTSGEDCLKRIADATDGIYCKFKNVKSFSTAFSFLLPENRDKLMLPETASKIGADEIIL